jgi:acyl-CoA synthetase (AMP-forming)/AMP-acid ligase II
MHTRFTSLVHALQTHAVTHPEDLAYTALNERGGEAASLTYAELDRRASALADALAARAAPGERALFVFPPGLEFLVAFFACQYASIIAVPTIFPRQGRLRDSSVKIVENCVPKLGLTTGAAVESMRTLHAEVPNAAGIEWLGIDTMELPPPATPAGQRPIPDVETLGLLQYTSGSTSAPKGVMVSHGNLCANVEMISASDDLGRSSTRVGWIPLYHDMGLIFIALQAAYVGAHCVLMAPQAFVAHPLSWLKAIQKYRAEMTIAPNFAYDLCLEHYSPERMEGVDLSCLRLALNGAEPVRATTIEQFAKVFAAHGLRPSAPHPTYGMAEATLMISGGMHGGRPRLWHVSRELLQRNVAATAAEGERAQTLVGCGKVLVGEKIAIVDPDTRERRSVGEVGEIWVQGPLVAQGYWQAPEATQETFHGTIQGEDGSSWLRTGDLGCFDDTGELYITGRIKDIMIVRGSNYYPQDLEQTAEKSNPALRRGYAAAFTFMEEDERELLAIVCEVRKDYLDRLDIDAVVGDVRMAVVREHELTVHRIILTPPGTVPKTTSGKIRRTATRERWQSGELPTIEASTVEAPTVGRTTQRDASA